MWFLALGGDDRRFDLLGQAPTGKRPNELDQLRQTGLSQLINGSERISDGSQVWHRGSPAVRAC